MGRIYSVPFTGTVTAAGGDADLFSFQPASNKPIKLRGFRLSQFTEVADAQEEGLRITVRRLMATVTIGSGGTAITAIEPPSDSADQVWSFTARANDSTVATSSGNNRIIEEIGWNERNTPCDFWYPDVQFCPKAKNGEALVIRMETTLADDMSVCLTAFVEEE